MRRLNAEARAYVREVAEKKWDRSHAMKFHNRGLQEEGKEMNRVVPITASSAIFALTLISLLIPSGGCFCKSVHSGNRLGSLDQRVFSLVVPPHASTHD